MVSKDDTSLSVSKAVYGAPLTVPGEALSCPPSSFLHKIREAVAGFAVSQPHHVKPFPPALLSVKFVLEDPSVPSLAPLYHGPCLVLES